MPAGAGCRGCRQPGLVDQLTLMLLLLLPLLLHLQEVNAMAADNLVCLLN
jgi:hypothetical protein